MFVAGLSLYVLCARVAVWALSSGGLELNAAAVGLLSACCVAFASQARLELRLGFDRETCLFGGFSDGQVMW